MDTALTQNLQELRQNIASVYMGNALAIDRVIITLLSRGHILIEDVPGVGKTILASAVAKSIKGSFARIQCTPDLLPSDITGVNMLDRTKTDFTFREGPVFNNIIVADEINRTTPRTQSALLEAMSENCVTVDGDTRTLPSPFMVIATQNPYEFEGTYFLPENQLDRFLMRIHLGYPSPDDESRVIKQQPLRNTLQTLKPLMSTDEVELAQKNVDEIKIADSLIDYIIALSTATRHAEDLQVGISTRGGLALAQVAKATALLNDRDYCIPEDIVSNVLPVCAHRVVSRTYMHDGDTNATRRIMQQVLETVPSPA
ncbi:MAG: MoxR family ATPase [Phycisphaerae bacterium]|jgi:MoxR-like ATPase|nr:MoxR family ATPase [Phycisphaerae bacterium]MBT6269980.1 MoxR family ATPase [Phycisphaerae bacterium]MBT6281778.1 MoxR family ATPase [Phycisphaerae bacterium]